MWGPQVGTTGGDHRWGPQVGTTGGDHGRDRMWGPQVRSTTGAAKLAEPLVSTLKAQMSVCPCVRVSVDRKPWG